MPPSSTKRKKGSFLTGLVTGFFIGFVLSNLIFLHRISTKTCLSLDDVTAPHHTEATTNTAVSSKPLHPKSSPPPRTKHEPIQRISCHDLFQQVRDGTVQDPNNGTMHKKFTETDPPFWISLHDKKIDYVRWGIMKFGKYYEKFITRHVKEIFKDEPSHSIMIDVGSNIGWFTIWAKVLGHDVVAFEPNQVNILRFCESLVLNNWTVDDPDVKVYPYGVGDEETKLPLIDQGQRNPGLMLFDKHMTNITDGNYIRIVTLDMIAEEEGWFEAKTPIPLLKVDVEGFDPFVFKGADRLLKSGLVKNIFMEYSCSLSEENDMKLAVLQIAREKYSLKNVGRWTGGTMGAAMEQVKEAKDENDLASKLYDICKKAAHSLNLWWVKSSMV